MVTEMKSPDVVHGGVRSTAMWPDSIRVWPVLLVGKGQLVGETFCQTISNTGMFNWHQQFDKANDGWCRNSGNVEPG